MLDIAKDPLQCEDDSVSYVYSSGYLVNIRVPQIIFREIVKLRFVKKWR